MGENYKKILTRVLDCITEGKPIPDEDWKQLEKAYAKALNNSPCPCDSGTKFADCCKQDWMVVSRGRAGQAREAMEDKRNEHQGKPPRSNEPRQMSEDVDWILHIGLNKQTGAPSFHCEKQNWTAFKVTSLMLNSYHTMLVEALAGGINDTQMVADRALKTAKKALEVSSKRRR